MRPPIRLYIAPFNFRVVIDPKFLEDVGGSGASSAKRQIIALDDEHEEQRRDTLLHESLHMLFRQTSLYKNTENWNENEEDIVSALAPRILNLLRDNPKLVAYLTEK